MKKMQWFFVFCFFNLSVLAQTPPLVLRSRKPTILVPPQSSHLSLFLNLESRFILHKKIQQKTPLSQNRLKERQNLLKGQESPLPWTNLDLIGSYEISPFPFESLNIGFQGTLGSSGLVFYTFGKWIPFPDYNYQPALGMIGEVYGGLSPYRQKFAGINIQFIAQKSFTGMSLLEEWGLYFIPLIRFNFLPKNESNKWTTDWILGLNFNFDENPPLTFKWSFNVEGRYNSSFSLISLQLLLYIQ